MDHQLSWDMDFELEENLTKLRMIEQEYKRVLHKRELLNNAINTVRGVLKELAKLRDDTPTWRTEGGTWIQVPAKDVKEIESKKIVEFLAELMELENTITMLEGKQQMVQNVIDDLQLKFQALKTS